jgi:hypothetical protein
MAACARRGATLQRSKIRRETEHSSTISQHVRRNRRNVTKKPFITSCSRH